jgi:hypothetical protein
MPHRTPTTTRPPLSPRPSPASIGTDRCRRCPPPLAQARVAPIPPPPHLSSTWLHRVRPPLPLFPLPTLVQATGRSTTTLIHLRVKSRPQEHSRAAPALRPCLLSSSHHRRLPLFIGKCLKAQPTTPLKVSPPHMSFPLE